MTLLKKKNTSIQDIQWRVEEEVGIGKTTKEEILNACTFACVVGAIAEQILFLREQAKTEKLK